jgi:flagellar protein FliO/FliZ
MHAPITNTRRTAALARPLHILYSLVPLLATPCVALAADGRPAPFAAPAQFESPSGGGGMLRLVLALALVLGLVFAAGWLMRRLRGISAGGAPGLEVIGQASLGTRERAVLLRVGQRQLLLGVAAGSVRLLTEVSASGEAGATLPTPSSTFAEFAAAAGVPPSTPPGPAFSAPARAAARPSFRDLLLRSLGQ